MSKRDYMSGFVLKFIFRDLYEGRPDLIGDKLITLEKYSPEKADVARALVNAHDLAYESWEPLVPAFDAWYADVKHKAELYRERAKLRAKA